MKENEQFKANLEKWLEQQEFGPEIFVATLAIVAGEYVGKRARKGDPADLSMGINIMQCAVLLAALRTWSKK